MGGLRAHMPITFATMWIATLAIAGIWPFAGFFSKDEIIWYAGAWAGAENAPFPGLYTVYWILALAAAMLTAFYMTRMMVMTFHGDEPHWVPRKRSTCTRAPAVMWVPLAVLAVLSVFGGWINVPEELSSGILGGLGWPPSDERVAAPLARAGDRRVPTTSRRSTSGSTRTTRRSAGVRCSGPRSRRGGGVVGRGRLDPLRRGPGGRSPAAEDKTELTGFAKVLYNKYYVDEIYDRFIVQPIVSASRFCWKVIDATIIDGFVNLVGWTPRLLGAFVGFFHTGSINTYAFVLTLGVLAVLGAEQLNAFFTWLGALF